MLPGQGQRSPEVMRPRSPVARPPQAPQGQALNFPRFPQSDIGHVPPSRFPQSDINGFDGDVKGTHIRGSDFSGGLSSVPNSDGSHARGPPSVLEKVMGLLLGKEVDDGSDTVLSYNEIVYIIETLLMPKKMDRHQHESFAPANKSDMTHLKEEVFAELSMLQRKVCQKYHTRTAQYRIRTAQYHIRTAKFTLEWSSYQPTSNQTTRRMKE
jgi:hypothetical protein